MNALSNRDALTRDERVSHRQGDLLTRYLAADRAIGNITAEIEADATMNTPSEEWISPAAVEDMEDRALALQAARAAYFATLVSRTAERRYA